MKETRIKTHSFPGDVPKHQKEAMLEGRLGELPQWGGDASPKSSINKWKKDYILSRRRAISKERTQKLIQNQLDLID